MTKYDLKAIARAAREDVDCVIPGSVLMYLANAVKEKHRNMLAALELAEQIGMDTGNSADAIQANENVGCFLLGIIETQFGTDFLNMFIGDNEAAPAADGSASIN